jgi:hypothetical protein
MKIHLIKWQENIINQIIKFEIKNNKDIEKKMKKGNQIQKTKFLSKPINKNQNLGVLLQTRL